MGKITPFGAYFRSPVSGDKCLLTPEISIDMQIALDSDVLIALDDCRHSDVSRKDAEESVKMTTMWAGRAMNHFLKDFSRYREQKKIFAVVQGGNFKDLREKSAKELMKMGFDGYCFGGWPMDGEHHLVEDILAYTAEMLPSDRPKYAMGIGTPENIQTCVQMGYNMFDCVLPTRNARHGLLYTSEGRIRITESKFKLDQSPIDPNCSCFACKNHSRAYIHHLLKNGEATGRTLATIHNVTFYADLMRKLGSAKA
jgi:queuine tRNA-ribosyltransferase